MTPSRGAYSPSAGVAGWRREKNTHINNHSKMLNEYRQAIKLHIYHMITKT